MSQKSQKILSLIALCICIFCITTCLRKPNDNQKFEKLSNTIFQETLSENILNLHYTIAHPKQYGIKHVSAKLPLYNQSSSANTIDQNQKLQSQLEKIAIEKLTPKNQATYKQLTKSLRLQTSFAPFLYYEDPFSPGGGVQTQLPLLLAEYRFESTQDITDYFAILSQIPQYFQSLLLYETDKTKAGIPLYAHLLLESAKQCDTIVTSDSLTNNTHFLQSSFSERLSLSPLSKKLSEKKKQQYLNENNRLLQSQVLPAYQKLATSLKTLAKNASKDRPKGLASLPNGQDYYQYLLQKTTGSDLSALEMKALLEKQLQKECSTLGALIRSNPEYRDELTKNQYISIPIKGTYHCFDDLQRQLFTHFPKLPGGKVTVTVKRVWDSMTDFCAPAFYLSSPIDDWKNNVIYMNKKGNTNPLVFYTTLAHEGYPGHLYENVYVSQQLEKGSKNPLDLLLSSSGYHEGWALYVEFIAYDCASKLFEETNRKTDSICVAIEKHSRNLQLCLYTLLDYKIHYENADFNEVADFLDHFGIQSSKSQEAIYDYIQQNPCNYPKYYLSYLEILSLKEQAKALWSDHYTDLAFHQFYLDHAGFDFSILEELLTQTTWD